MTWVCGVTGQECCWCMPGACGNRRESGKEKTIA